MSFDPPVVNVDRQGSNLKLPLLDEPRSVIVSSIHQNYDICGVCVLQSRKQFVLSVGFNCLVSVVWPSADPWPVLSCFLIANRCGFSFCFFPSAILVSYFVWRMTSNFVFRISISVWSFRIIISGFLVLFSTPVSLSSLRKFSLLSK